MLCCFGLGHDHMGGIHQPVTSASLTLSPFDKHTTFRHLELLVQVQIVLMLIESGTSRQLMHPCQRTRRQSATWKFLFLVPRFPRTSSQNPW